MLLAPGAILEYHQLDICDFRCSLQTIPLYPPALEGKIFQIGL